MRLQLTALLCAAAWGGGSASTRVDAYVDPWIDVIMPSVRAAWEGEQLDLEAAYGVDALTGATQVLVVDGVTGATSYTEQRHQVDLGAGVRPGDWGLRARYGLSSEPDYLTHGAGIGGSVDLFQSMTTLGADLRASVERMGMSTDPQFDERTLALGVDLTWDQIVDRRTTARLLGSVEHAWCGDRVGCVANPYRYVAVDTEVGTLLGVAERNPDRLGRLALGTRLSRALGGSAAVHATYRFYVDTWQVTGHTGQLEGALQLAQEALLLRGELRGSTQGAASFYRDAYATTADAPIIPTYRTGDRELSGLRSVRVGGGPEWAWHDVGPFLRVAVGARLARAWYAYPDFSELPERQAWIVGGGMDAEL